MPNLVTHTEIHLRCRNCSIEHVLNCDADMKYTPTCIELDYQCSGCLEWNSFQWGDSGSQIGSTSQIVVGSTSQIEDNMGPAFPSPLRASSQLRDRELLSAEYAAMLITPVSKLVN